MSNDQHQEPPLDIDALLAENARLGAVVERQPKTADGVPAHNGMKVWYPGDDDYGTVTFHVCDEGGYTAINKCYSTHAAAEAAKAASAHHGLTGE